MSEDPLEEPIHIHQPVPPVATAHQKDLENKRQVDCITQIGFTKQGNIMSKKCPTKDDVEEIMKKAFLQKGGPGGPKDAQYIRLRCVNFKALPPCSFALYVYDLDDEGYELRTNPNPLCQWHAATCTRPAKGQHGLTQQQRKIAVEKRPRKALLEMMENTAKNGREQQPQVADQQPQVVPQPHVPEPQAIGVTRRMCRAVRSYTARMQKALYEEDPAAYIAEKFPGCVVTKFDVENTTVHTLTRPWLLSLVQNCDGGRLYADGTYWVVNRHGNLVTLCVEIHATFIPVFAAVSETDDDSRAPESTQHLTTIFEAFAKAINDLLLISWTPNMLIRDHASAFIKACRAVFGNSVADALCFFHVQQANECHIKLEVKSRDIGDEMLELAQIFRYCTMEEYDHGLQLAERELGVAYPVWARWFSLNRNAGRAPGGINQAWIGTYEDNCGIERWHETLKATAVAHGHLRGHLPTRTVLEILCELFTENEKLLNTTSPKLSLPIFFEKREEKMADLTRTAKKDSEMYQAALEREGIRSYPVFMTSTRDEVRVITDYELGIMTVAARESFQAWRAMRRVYRVCPDSCTCPAFVSLKFCKHQVAMKAYADSNNLPSPRGRLAVIPQAISTLPQSHNAAKHAENASTPERQPKPNDYLTPEQLRSFHHPTERPMNSWQLQHQQQSSH